MAFTDPQSVTISGTAISLPRTSTDVNAGVFTAADGTTDLSVSHQTSGRRSTRRMRLHVSKIASDPFVVNANIPVDMSVSLVVNVGKQGYTIAEQKAVVDAFLAYLTASTGAKISQLLGGEN